MRHLKHRTNAGLVTKVAELALAAPQVVSMRTAQMLAAGANPSARDRAEAARMVPEKVSAFWESMFGMSRQLVTTQQQYARTAGLKWLKLWTTPWWLVARSPAARAAAIMAPAAALVPTVRQRQRAAVKLLEKAVAPVHKRATANSRRLTRIKKRRAR